MTPAVPDTTLLAALIVAIKGTIALLMEPPVIWFVYLGLVVAGVGVIRRLLPGMSRR